MEEQLVSFETAKLAKKEGFNVPTQYYYNVDGYTSYGLDCYGDDVDVDVPLIEGANWNDKKHIPWPNNSDKVSCSAPTQSLLQKWLRETFQIDITIHRSSAVDNAYHYCILVDDDYANDKKDIAQTVKAGRIYETALEEALSESFRLIEKLHLTKIKK